MKTIVSLMAFTSLLLLGGCAGTLKELPDGRFLSAVTAGDTLDRSATYVQILEKAGVDEKGKPVLKQVAGDLTVGPTVAGDTVKGVTQGLGVAAVQHNAAIRTAKIKTKALTCPDGTTACHSTVIAVQGAQAAAGSTAVSESITTFDAVFGTCPTGGCIAVPME